MDDTTLAISIVTAIFLILLTAIVYLYSKSQEPAPENEEVAAPSGPQPRRPLRNTTARERLRATLAERSNEEPPPGDEGDQDPPSEAEEGDNEGVEAPNIPAKKISKKKQEKMELKAEKRAMIEAQEKAKKEKREKEAELEEERKKQEEEEEAIAAKVAEEERKVREEKEKKEKEEYEKMKKLFVVEESGFDQDDDSEKEKNLLKEFVAHIKNEKVVLLEELGAKFGLRTQAAINRVKDLQEAGQLTGVLDDRGKFIYVSKEELEAVSKFIRQRGRVTMSELAEASGELISFERVAERA